MYRNSAVAMGCLMGIQLTLRVIMLGPFQHKAVANYWLKVFALYALAEACIQLLFLFILNNFGTHRISIVEYHLMMWIFQCLLIWPIWSVAWLVRKQRLIVQVIVNILFYVIYSYCWFGPVQDAIIFFYDHLQALTRVPADRQVPIPDKGTEYSYLNYQLLKHGFRLSWFYLAARFYDYRREEKKKMALAIANRELQIKLLKWHLNPSFYFKTIDYLRQVASTTPSNATGPILQLARLMEYVIYEAKEKLTDVKKELLFIGNYIQLINQQPDNHTTIEMEVSGDPGRLQIAPLILAGFIDNVAMTNGKTGNRRYNLQLQFEGNEMCLAIQGDHEDRKIVLPMADDGLHQRLEELYPQRFDMSYPNGNTQFKLSMQLDAAR